MKQRLLEDEPLKAVGRRGCGAVIERPETVPPDTEAGPLPLRPHGEHGRETVVAFLGDRRLDAPVEHLLGMVLAEFLEDAPRHGYQNLVLASEDAAPFRPLIEGAVRRATDALENLSVRFTTALQRVDLFVVLQWAHEQDRAGMERLVRRVSAQRAAELLFVGPDTEIGDLFFSVMASMLRSHRCEAFAEYVNVPPEPGTDLRLSARMFLLLNRGAPA